MPTEDRRVGKLLPDPVTPATTVCFRIQIPDAVAYRAAFLGQINVLGQALTWDHERGANECIDCEEAAQLWRNAIYNATWTEECEDIVDCNEVANCIETSEAVQTAINQQIASNAGNQTTIYNTSQYGTPLTAAQLASPTVTSIDCEPNSLFGSITAVVEQMDKNNRDFLEIIEVGTNTRERVSTLIAAIPLFETLPINEGIDYIDKLQSEILENYEAQWTTALYDEYRCDLFCIARDADDCELTFEQIYNYFDARLGAALDPENLFAALVQYFILGTWAGSTVVDIMMLNQVGIWRAASNFSGISLRTLETVGLLGANDNNSDWAILCNCAPVEGCAGGTTFNYIESEYGFEPYIDRAIWIDNEGWKRNIAAASNRIAIMRNISPHASKIRVWTNETVGGIVIYKHTPGVETVALGTCTYVGMDAIGHMYQLATIPSYTNYLMIEVSGSPVADTARIRRTCVNYD